MDRFPTVAAGRVDGFASSTKAELAGLFAAITVSPRNTPATIYIDNSAVVSQFRELVRGREACTERQRLRSPYAVWWAAVHNAYIVQGKKVNVIWVRGHAGNKGNEAADKAAKDGHMGELWSIKEQEHNDLTCHALFNNRVVEDDLRQLLKRQSAVRTNALWSRQNRTEKYIPRWQEVDWKATLHIIHNGNTPRGLFTSTADCHKRAHKIKKMHGMLPTLSYMKQWRPDLYETDICRMCELDREDTEHLWKCSITDDKQLAGWKKAVESFKADGKRALAQERKVWEQQQQQAKERGLAHGGHGPQFTPAPEAAIWRVLQSKFQGVTAIRKAGRVDAEPVEDGLGEDAIWSVQNLYHGLTPKDLVQDCKRTFKTSMSIARYVAGRFVKAIEDVGKAEIWIYPETTYSRRSERDQNKRR
jgi:ribonuclease HI